MSRGIALSVASSCLFAGLYYYASLLSPLNGEQIFGWRMLLTLPCITAFLVATGEWERVKEIAARLRAKPSLALALLCSSALLGAQQWLFLWAPINGRALQVSLGYFLLPLVMLVTGRLLFNERLSLLQKAAGAVAAIGVAHELYRAGGFSWEALLVALGFPAYFILRKKIGTDNLGGLWFDMLLTIPMAVFFIAAADSELSAFLIAPKLYVLVPLLAVLSAAAFMSYMRASRLLPLSLFGLLGYVEPVLMVAASMALGERVQGSDWLTYGPIWMAVALLVLNGGIHLMPSTLRSRRPIER